mgnify:CR=1 FL=1
MLPAVEPKLSPEELAEVVAALESSYVGRTILGKGLNAGHDKGRAEGRTEGRAEGRAEGLGPIEHLFERRLRRALTAAEHAELLRRLDTLGPDRIGDVVLDLTPEALAAWIADPDAR